MERETQANGNQTNITRHGISDVPTDERLTEGVEQVPNVETPGKVGGRYLPESNCKVLRYLVVFLHTYTSKSL